MNNPPDPPRQLDQFHQLDQPLFDPSPHPMGSQYPLPSSLYSSRYTNPMMSNPANTPTRFDQPLSNLPDPEMRFEYHQPLPHYPSRYSNGTMTDPAYLPTQYHQALSNYSSLGMGSQYPSYSPYDPSRHPNATISGLADPLIRFDQPVSEYRSPYPPVTPYNTSRYSTTRMNNPVDPPNPFDQPVTEYPFPEMGSQYPSTPYNTSRYSNTTMNDPADPYAHSHQLDQRMQTQHPPLASVHPSAYLNRPDPQMQYHSLSSVPSSAPPAMMTSSRTPQSIAWAPPILSSTHPTSFSTSGTPRARSSNVSSMVASSRARRALNRNTGPMAASSGIQRRRNPNQNRRGIGPNGETRPPPLGLRRMLRHELRVLQQFHSQVEPDNEPLATDTAVENWYWSWAINDVDPDRNTAWESFLRDHSTASEITSREQALSDYQDLKDQQPEKEKAWKRLYRRKLITYI